MIEFLNSPIDPSKAIIFLIVAVIGTSIFAYISANCDSDGPMYY